MRSPTYWAGNCFDLRLRFLPTTAKHAARSQTSISSASSKEPSKNSTKSELWLELLSDSGVIKPRLIQPLGDETNELIAIFVTMTKKVKTRRQRAG
jgi:hypothetical protein